MAQLTPAKPDFYDGTWRGKIRIWKKPVFASGDFVVVPGLKQVFEVSYAKGEVAFTSSNITSGGVTIYLTVTASSTGDTQPLAVYGQ